MSRKLTTEEFIKRAREVHGDKYDYFKVKYVNSQTKIEIICPEHGKFYQTPNNHLKGKGCPKCNGGIFLGCDDFVQKAKKVHRDRYDYSRVEYINSKTKVCIICPEHGEFWQTPDKHLQGDGCPECAGNKLLTCENFVKKAILIHSDKYDYSFVDYVNYKTKVKIVCPEHGPFWQKPANHLQGCGCPECGKKVSLEQVKKGFNTRKQNGTLNSSRLQEMLEFFLFDEFKNDVVSEYNQDKRYPFNCDFYIKSLDLFIELNGFWTHGEHWFDETNSDDIEQLERWKEKKSKFYDNAIETWTQRDVKKREYARKNNLNYVVFWGDCKQDISQWFDGGCPVRQDWK